MAEFNYQDLARQQTSGFTFSTISSHNSQSSQSPQPSLHHLSSARSYADLNYLFGTQDPTVLVPKHIRNRRRPDSVSEHVKHRRTRSGCYTCRSRRVKCDETHPICGKCQKGGRECVYPERALSSKSKGSSLAKRKRSETRECSSSSSEEDDNEDGHERLGAIPDGGEVVEINKDAAESSTADQLITHRKDSATPPLERDKANLPVSSMERSVDFSGPQAIDHAQRLKSSLSPSDPDNLRSDWSHLPPDLQMYLTYFYENVNHLHYSLKTDPCNFLKTIFIDAALRNDALLYAVVGFAAFQRTLYDPNGKIQDFLPYYNKAVSILLKSLQKGEKHSTGTLLAILQLATIEEFLGDWMNLLGHQKAAYEILTELYTPQSVMQSEISRVILGWYMRFDVFAGLMGGFETVLSREWFSHAQEHFVSQVIQQPTDINAKIELVVAQLRLLAMDMTTLFAKIGKGEINFDHFVRENTALAAKMQEWKTNMDPALLDSRYLVTEFADASQLDPDDIVNPYIPGIVYDNGPLFVMNICFIDWYSIDLMHRYQTALTMQTQPGPELIRIAYDTCQRYEAIEFYPGSPPGIVLALQASLGIACIFLPRDDRHSMWARRKLATVEANGYIFSYTIRTKMSDLFRDRSCMHWWLPNDEGYSPIIRSIRNFVEERTAPAKDNSSEDLRDMKAVFSSLNLEEGPSRSEEG